MKNPIYNAVNFFAICFRNTTRDSCLRAKSFTKWPPYTSNKMKNIFKPVTVRRTCTNVFINWLRSGFICKYKHDCCITSRYNVASSYFTAIRVITSTIIKQIKKWNYTSIHKKICSLNQLLYPKPTVIPTIVAKDKNALLFISKMISALI